MRFAFVLFVAGVVNLGSTTTFAQAAAPPNPQAVAQGSGQPNNQAPPAMVPPTATSPQAASTLAGMPIDTVPRKYIDVWNTGNFDGMPALFYANTAMTSHGHRILLKPEMVRKVVNAWRKSMPDLTFKIEDTVIQGDKVVMRLSFRGTYKERLFPNTDDPANTPRIVHATEIVIFRVEGVKIREIWEEYDELAMRVQMGGFWRTNDELAAAWKAAPKPIQPPPDNTPLDLSPPKP